VGTVHSMAQNKVRLVAGRGVKNPKVEVDPKEPEEFRGAALKVVEVLMEVVVQGRLLHQRPRRPPHNQHCCGRRVCRCVISQGWFHP